MPSINFFSEDVSFTPQNRRVLQDWISTVVSEFQSEIDSINFIYCSDNYLLEINKEYLDHDYFTDIITFDNRDDLSEAIDADIFISIDRVKENAASLSQDFQNELHRVMIHGVHHLLGQGDRSDEEKQQMRKREEASLSLLPL